MRIIKCVCNLADDSKRCFKINDPGIRRVKNVGERAAVQPFHDQEIQIVVAIDVYEANNIRMDEATSFGRFLLECAQGLAALSQLWGQDLNRDPMFVAAGLGQTSIQRFVDDSHAAAGYFLLQHESITQHRSDLHTRIGRIVR